MDLTILKKDIRKFLDIVLKDVGLVKLKYTIDPLRAPHKTKQLPSGKMAIYMFLYKNKFLKIGKVGLKSKARFNQHHYSPGSSNSNLSKSMLKDKKDNPWNRCNESTIGPWIKNNVDRINLFFKKGTKRSILNLIEAALHYKFNPKYEES